MYRHHTPHHHQGIFVVVIIALSNVPLYCLSVSSPGSFSQVGGEYRTSDRMLWFSSVAAGTYLECFLSHLHVFFHLSLTTPWLLPLTSSPRFLSLILTILYIICQGRWKRAVKSTRKLIESLFRESVNTHLLYDISGSHGCKFVHYDLVGCKRLTVSGRHLKCFHIICMTYCILICLLCIVASFKLCCV